MSLDVNICEPEEFNSNELHSCIKETAKKIGINNFEYHVEHLSGSGRENYIANIFRVFIKDIEIDKSINVIVKTLMNTSRQELFHDLHEREVIVYNEVIPKFQYLQEKLEMDQRVMFPVCVYSNAEKTKDIIILKDLNEAGFHLDDTLARFDELNYDKICIIMTELAKFHALSIVYENYNNEEFQKLRAKFDDILFSTSFLNKSRLRNYFEESYDMSLNLITDIDIKNKLRKVKPKLLEILKLYCLSSKFNVLCHGDLWMNNILFNTMNNTCKICFLDFQAMRYASPANDIIYFIYLSTTSKFRSEYFQDILSIYYDSLTSALKAYDLCTDKIYPRERFEKDINEKQPFGLLMALVELRIITMTPEDDAILKVSATVSGSSLTEVPGENELFKFRVDDLVQESVRNGVLDGLMNKIN